MERLKQGLASWETGEEGEGRRGLTGEARSDGGGRKGCNELSVLSVIYSSRLEALCSQAFGSNAFQSQRTWGQ